MKICPALAYPWRRYAVTAGTQPASLPVYVPARQVTGSIRICGSPQMGGLLQRWEAGFQKFQPGVRFEDNLQSTSTAVAGLDSGRADIALLGRDLWPTEVDVFESIEGHRPISIQVATGSYDVPKATYALMIFVHAGNPLTKLSMQRLEDIFGAGDAGSREIRTWGDLGLTGEWAHQAIHLYGFDLKNDKAIFFQTIVLQRTHRWNGGIREYSNTSTPPVDAGQIILNRLAKDRYGIAISNVHYVIPGVKMLAIGRRSSGPFVVPTKESVQSRTYPLVRPVNIVINRSPHKEFDPKVVEFLRYILSGAGQRDIANEGNYLPLPDQVVRAQLRVLSLNRK